MNNKEYCFNRAFIKSISLKAIENSCSFKAYGVVHYSASNAIGHLLSFHISIGGVDKGAYKLVLRQAGVIDSKTGVRKNIEDEVSYYDNLIHLRSAISKKISSIEAAYKQDNIYRPSSLKCVKTIYPRDFLLNLRQRLHANGSSYSMKPRNNLSHLVNDSLILRTNYRVMHGCGISSHFTNICGLYVEYTSSLSVVDIKMEQGPCGTLDELRCELRCDLKVIEARLKECLS